jgi:hypothetical protein
MSGLVRLAMAVGCAWVLSACDGKRQDATTAPASNGLSATGNPRPGKESRGGNSALDRLEQACVEAMIKNTCTIMNSPSASQTSEVVFVAGVGAIDAKAYKELKASGEAMCGTVRQACERSWDDPRCKTARSLWPQ